MVRNLVELTVPYNDWVAPTILRLNSGAARKSVGEKNNIDITSSLPIKKTSFVNSYSSVVVQFSCNTGNKLAYS